LSQVRQFWKKYHGFAAPESKDHKTFRDAFVKSFVDIHRTKAGGLIGSAIRAAGANATAAIYAVIKEFDTFWATGVVGGLSELQQNATCLNPLFVFSKLGGERCMIYFGCDPILGFHCSTAFAEILPDETTLSSFPQYRESEDTETSVRRFAKTAMHRFKLWCSAFRSAAIASSCGTSGTERALEVHHCCGDTLEFCFAAQTTLGKLESKFNIFETCAAPWKEPLSFPKDSAFVGPFDVIDTSNAADQIGMINILISSLPLLKQTPNATLYTEHLVTDIKKGTRPFDRLKSLLFGDPCAIFFLLGAAPMECLTGVNTNSSYLEEICQRSRGLPASQKRLRLSWKQIHLGDPTSGSPFPDPIVCASEPESLAQFLADIYQEMFQADDPGSAMQSFQMTRSFFMRHYVRASFVALLSLVQRRVTVGNWDDFFERLMILVSRGSADIASLKGLSYQEFSLQLHLQGLYTCGIIRQTISAPARLPQGWFESRLFPTALGLLFRVPRARCYPILDEFEPLKAKLNIVFEVDIFCPPYQNRYASIQYSFENEISGDELPEAWRGSGDLIIYLRVPSWTIIQNFSPESKIYLRLRPDVATVQSFRGSSLGPLLTVFETNLNNTRYVVPTNPRDCPISANRHDAAAAVTELPECSMPGPIISVVDGRVVSTTRITFKGSAQSKLSGGSKVASTQESPCTLVVSVGGVKFPVPILFPFEYNNLSLRLGRKSGWVEVVVPFTTNLSASSLNCDPFPVIRNKLSSEFSWNLPRLSPQRLPALNLSTKNDIHWINSNLMNEFSVREMALRQQHTGDRTTGNPLADLKEELYSVFTNACGLGASETPLKVFYLDLPDLGSMSIIFVTKIKLEENDATLVADACVVPLTMDLIQNLSSELRDLREAGPAISVRCVEESYKLWGFYLAACIERTRDWVHKPHCSIRKGTVESETIQPFDQMLCQCGAGQVSEEFKSVKEWKPFSRFATRCLLTPIFASHAMEQSIPDDIFDGIGNAGDSGSNLKAWGDEKTCAHCKTTGGVAGRKLLTCARCSRVVYCSKDCQKKDWKVHKRNCGKLGNN
jgi:MYND finger